MRKLPLAFSVFVSCVMISARLGAASYQVTADFPYASKYVFRGLPLARASLQPSVKLTAAHGYAGLWLNQPLASHPDLEVDLNAGGNIPLVHGWNLDAGGTMYCYTHADTKALDPTHTFEGYLGLNGAVHGTNVGAYLFRDFDLKNITGQVSASYSLPLNANATLSLSGAVGGVLPDHGARYTYGTIGAAVPCQLSDIATFTVGANWSTHDLAGVGKNNVWFTAGLTVVF